MDRATKGNGTATDLTFTARLISGMKYIITGQLSNQSNGSPASDTETTIDKTPFSAGQPLQPAFQEGMRGRQFDYRTGYNLTYTPRAEEPVTFSQLRSLADTYDLVRLAIETRKDQMCKLSFTIKSTNEKIKNDTRIQGIMEFLRYPDKEHNWQTWIRMLFEDLLVIDAPTIYPRPTKGGDLYALELIDGALIKRALDGTGRTPVAPDVAYQQIIKGVPAVDYCRPDMSQTGKIRHDLGDGNTIDELIYIPRNVRTHKVYGFSPVEQIITIVNIALRRQLHQLEYYTEGSIPDLLLSVPETWNPDQIRQFQEFWDSLLAGNTAERRHAKFIPHGITPYDVKQNAIKDEYDEWLARVVCFAFSLPPTAFVRQMNRASAETQKEQALEEGLMPIMEWVKSVMDLIIWKYFNSPDLEFVWQDVKEVDPLVQAQIDQIYLQEYVLSQDEVRVRMGLEGTAPEKPLPPTMGQDVLVAGNDEEEEKTNNTVKNPDNSTVNNEVKKVERAIKKKVLPINRQRKSIAKLRSKMTAICKDFFDIAADDIATQVQKGIAKLKRADSSSTEAEVEDILKQIDFASWSVLVVPIAEVIEQIHQDGASTALTQIGFHTDSNSMLNLLNKKAVEYAEQRAAEMVGMKNIGTKMYPEWVVNQDASFAITDSTREMLKELVTKSINEGWSTQQLESEIANSTGFSSERAEMIARTETAYADVQGNMTAYRESGVVAGKEWVVGSEHDDEDECLIGSTLVRTGPVRSGISRLYQGLFIKLHLSTGKELTGTPNHPVLTDVGWKPLKDIHQGDNLISDHWMKGIGVVTDYLDQVETRIEDKVASFAGRTATIKSSSGDFHGDGIGSHVYTITTNSALNNKVTIRANEIIEPLLCHGIKLSALLSCNRDSLMCFFNSCLSLFRISFARFQGRTFSLISQFKTSAFKSCGNGGFGNTTLNSNLRARQVLSEIKSGEIVSGVFASALSSISVLGVSKFTGSFHVYNLHTSDGLIIAENVITSNCDENEAAGVIGIDEVFPSGDDAPPAHPNCCCDVIPVVIDKEGEE